MIFLSSFRYNEKMIYVVLLFLKFALCHFSCLVNRKEEKTNKQQQHQQQPRLTNKQKCGNTADPNKKREPKGHIAVDEPFKNSGGFFSFLRKGEEESPPANAGTVNGGGDRQKEERVLWRGGRSITSQ